ncbi:DJ-1 protein [Serendipita vermifera]|nr:DJ-1 protein [Serendipita vermifera]
MPSALVLIANGTEEIEFTVVYDTLVRAGIECTSAFVPSQAEVGLSTAGGWGVTDVVATCSRGVKITADTTLEALLPQNKTFDAVILPGGMKGAETFAQSEQVRKLVSSQYGEGRLLGMICAAPLAALSSQLPKQPLTSHPSVKGQLEGSFDYKEESVVVSGKFVTSRGPGTAFPFAFKLVEMLCGEEKVKSVRDPMVFGDS